MVPDHDPVYKVSIIPRGRALGVTMYLPEGDAHASLSIWKSRSHPVWRSSGGRNDLRPRTCFYRASNDIKVATNLARNMVTQWGLSDQLGPLLYAEEDGEVFLGRSMAKAKHMSDETARIIDAEVKQSSIVTTIVLVSS
ncbi:hypothetical protein ACNKHQ_18480 [Shigella flexneri]